MGEMLCADTREKDIANIHTRDFFRPVFPVVHVKRTIENNEDFFAIVPLNYTRKSGGLRLTWLQLSIKVSVRGF
jgi:hypothetical protein